MEADVRKISPTKYVTRNGTINLYVVFFKRLFCFFFVTFGHCLLNAYVWPAKTAPNLVKVTKFYYTLFHILLIKKSQLISNNY